MKQREYKIGEVFNIGRGTYIVRAYNGGCGCVLCGLRSKKACLEMKCASAYRKDGKNVIFERV